MIQRTISALILAALTPLLTGCFPLPGAVKGDPEKAAANAKAHYEALGLAAAGIELMGVSPTNSDSDGDGYLAVTVSLKDRETGAWHIVDWECGGGKLLSTTDGCKTRMPKSSFRHISLRPGE